MAPKHRTALALGLGLVSFATWIRPVIAQEDPVPRGVRLVEVGRFALDGGDVFAIGFDATGVRFATGGEQGEVMIWDRGATAPAFSLDASDHWVGEVAFSPDGRSLATMGRGLSVWDLETRDRRFTCERTGPRGLAWSPDGSRLAFHAGGGAVRIVKADDHGTVREYGGEDRYPVNALLWSRDGRVLFAGDNVGKVWRLDLASGKAEVRRDHREADRRCWLDALAWSAGGELLSADSDGVVRGPDGVVAEHGGGLYAFAAAADGSTLVGAGAAGRITLWDAAGAVRQRFALPDRVVQAVAVAPDGEVVTAADDGGLWFWRDGKIVRELRGHPSQPKSVGFTRDSRHAVASADRTALFEVETGRERVLPVGGAVGPGRRGAEVAVLTAERLELWEPGGAAPALVLPAPGSGHPSLVSVSPDGKRAVLARVFGGCRLLDLESGALEEVGVGYESGLDVAWGATGAKLTVATVKGHHGEFGALLHRAADGTWTKVAIQFCAFLAVDAAPDGEALVWSWGGGSLQRQSVAWGLARGGVDARAARATVAAEVSWLRFLDAETLLTASQRQLEVRDAATLAVRSVIPLESAELLALAPNRSVLAVASRRDVRVYRIRR